jgi:hypothetical protein
MADKGSPSIRSATSTATQASTSRSLSRGAQEDRTTWPRHLRTTVLPWLGLLVCATGGCGSSSTVADSQRCPKLDFSVLNIGCVSSQQPVVKTTGPCTAFSSDGQNANLALILTSDDAGTCHVEWTFGSGATSSVDVDFMSAQLPGGSRGGGGCGQGFVAVTKSGSPCIGCQLSVPGLMEGTLLCDAGLGPLD